MTSGPAALTALQMAISRRFVLLEYRARHLGGAQPLYLVGWGRFFPQDDRVMSSDQPDTQHADTSSPQATAAEQAAVPSAPAATPIAEVNAPDVAKPAAPAMPTTPRIAIGSQRAGSRIQRPRIPPALAPRPKPKPIPQEKPPEAPTTAPAAPLADEPVGDMPQEPVAVAPTSAAPAAAAPVAKPAAAPVAPKPPRADLPPPPSGAKAPVPSIRGELPPELQREVDEALGGFSLEEVLEPGQKQPAAADLEPESRHQARIVSIHNDDVFVELGGRNQGVLSLRQFPEPPAVGSVIEIAVHRFDADEGLYQLSLPNSAIIAANWGDITEGVTVEARVTGHNKGGLECEVNNIRAFIPASQIDVYRVEDLSQFVGQKFPAVVTEARPERGNLVLSRRAVMERQKTAAKEQLLTELAEGQIREGVVRSLQPFGAFIDLGGVDGLLHVSQLSWQRVKHPGDVLQLGQTVKVLVRKIDQETRKISLALRDLTDNPWTTVANKYPVSSTARGTVSKIMEFGAFVQLEPGIEGLVHISELAHKRVFRVGDIVKEGDLVDVKVQSVDPEQQRISLSMKALAARPGPVKQEEPEIEDLPPPPPTKRKTPLKGGLGRATGGEGIGLKW
jgi:predicted RNA-binding protein with RPS1 domain